MKLRKITVYNSKISEREIQRDKVSNKKKDLIKMLKQLQAANVESHALLEMLRRTKIDLASRDTREAARYVILSLTTHRKDRNVESRARRHTQGNGKESVDRVDGCL